MHLDIGPFQLTSTFLRLRPDASVEPLAVDGAFWQKLTTGQLGNFHNEYMVGTHAFEADWPMWEMHPNGEEIVYLLSGSTTFILETAEGLHSFTLSESGSYLIVPKGTWHTAKTTDRCHLLFITAGEGTQHRSNGND